MSWKTILTSAALAMTALGTPLAIPATAFAQEAKRDPSAGHYEWRSPPQRGPRASARAPVRVWVPSKLSHSEHPADCECPMMHGSAEQAADCMNKRGTPS